MVVRLKGQGCELEDITPGHQYAVIGIEAGDYRILNDQGMPYLYPQDIFEVIDLHEPQDWVSEVGEDGERYAYPPQLNTPGFFEDFFDGDPVAVGTLWQVVNQRLATAE